MLYLLLNSLEVLSHWVHCLLLLVRQNKILQWNLYNVDTLRTTEKRPDYRGVVIFQGCPQYVIHIFVRIQDHNLMSCLYRCPDFQVSWMAGFTVLNIVWCVAQSTIWQLKNFSQVN